MDTLKFYIYEENGKHRFLPENGEIEEGSVYIEPHVYGFTPITVKLDSRDISKKVNDGYRTVKKSFKESKMERKTMKKLNITKEQFNKSEYFQKKYGKLEYVSESGNLYKTNKGKILKFVKESDEPEGWLSEIHDKAYDKMARNLAKQIKEKVKLPAVAHEGGRRIGVYPWAKNLGDWNCWDEKKAQPFVDKIMDAFPGMLDYYGPGDLYGRPGLMFRLNFKYLFDKVNSGEFPYKESSNDIANDPALVCPYCGGNNCEISIATDDLNLVYMDKLDGETFNVEYWCLDCDKPYNVTVELRVKDVYPNEDSDL